MAHQHRHLDVGHLFRGERLDSAAPFGDLLQSVRDALGVWFRHPARDKCRLGGVRELLLGPKHALLRDDGRAHLAQFPGMVGCKAALCQREVRERAVGGLGLLLALRDEIVESFSLVEYDRLLFKSFFLEDRLHGEATGARSHRDKRRVRFVAG